MISIIFSEIKRMIGFDKKGFTTAILLGFLTSLLALGYTVSMNYLISALSLSSFGVIIGLFIIFAVIVVGRDLLNGIYNYELARHSFTVEGKLRTELMIKIQNLSPLSLERPSVLDKLEKSRAGIDPAIITLMGVEIISANCIVYFVMITVYLCRIHPLLSVVVLGTFIPTFVSYYVKTKVSAEAETQSAPYRRRMNYAESAVCDLEYFKETRHLKAVNYFVTLFCDAAIGFKKIRMKEANRACWINIAVNASYFLGYISIIAATCYLALTGKIAAGDIAAILVTVSVLISYLTELFSQYLASIMEAYAGLKNLHEVLQTDSDQLPAEDIQLHELHLSNVSFQYPENERLALDNINLTLHEGETVCIVGENGSGKSTLSKILLGLYSPTKGTVSVNGRKLSSNEFSTLQAVSSSVFQDFNKYALSLRDNISLGSDRIETDMLSDLISQLPDGVNTMLSKAFGGVDLSQGQWQRVAISRGISKPAQLAVFDEPTSAIDPILESELLEAMLCDNRHKTRIIITHRIGIASKATRILVLDKGKIVQDGTHQELIKQDGKYAEMFNAQGNWYQ